MEDEAMIDNIEDGNETCSCSSKETLFPLENEDEKVLLDMTANCEPLIENLNCDLDKLVLKVSSGTFKCLTDRYGDDEDNVNDDNMNEQIQFELIALANIIGRTQSNCNVDTGRTKKNNTDISSYDSNKQRNESLENVINNAVSEKGIKEGSSNTTTTKKLIKRAKSIPPTLSKSKNANEENVKLPSTLSTEFKVNNSTTIQCMESLINRRRIIYAKRLEAREKLAKMENETLGNIRKQRKKTKRSPRTKKLNPTFSSVYFFNPKSNIQCMTSLIERRKFNFNKKQEELKKREKDKKLRKNKPKINKTKFKKVRRGQLSKNQNNDTLHNEDKKNSAIKCTESINSRRNRQEARGKLAEMENEVPSNIRKQKKKKAKRSPRTKKLNPTFSSVYYFNPDSNIQCMQSIRERRKNIFNKKQELKNLNQDIKHHKHKPKINKRKLKKGRRDQQSKTE